MANAKLSKKDKSLVLVVGAGASYELGLPLGSGLKAQIASLLDIRYDHRRVSGDGVVDRAIDEISRASTSPVERFNEHLKACWRIRDAMPLAISIDNFIDAHRDNTLIEVCGKLAIVRSILAAERASMLYLDPASRKGTLNFRSFEATWLNPFFQLLTENCSTNDLPDRFSRVAIICFNYDRCIEYYLDHALQIYYGIRQEESREYLERLEIYHPYGTVGALPLQRGSADGMAFGGEPSPSQLVSLSAGIRTFTESSNVDKTQIVRARELLKQPARLAFIGFAFHRLNLELLFPYSIERTLVHPQSVYSTGVGISEDDSRVIVKALGDLAGVRSTDARIALGASCADLFNTHRRSLSFDDERPGRR